MNGNHVSANLHLVIVGFFYKIVLSSKIIFHLSKYQNENSKFENSTKNYATDQVY